MEAPNRVLSMTPIRARERSGPVKTGRALAYQLDRQTKKKPVPLDADTCPWKVQAKRSVPNSPRPSPRQGSATSDSPAGSFCFVP